MSRTPLRSAVVLSAVSLAALVGLAGPAAAQGGNPPPPAPAGIDCSALPHAADVAVNYAGDAGCVGVRVANGTTRLAWVVTNPGWTYVVKSNGARTNNRVEVLFTQTATGKKLTFRYELGRTRIG
jgi:hypothetical protein